MEEYTLHETHPEGYSLCVWVRERLPDLHEGFLDAATAETIRAHLSVCFLCAREYNEMESTIRHIEHLPFVEPVMDHAPAIMAAVRSQSGHSFRSPVVEVETEALRRVSVPRTTTGQQRQHGYSLTELSSLYGTGRLSRLRQRSADAHLPPGERAAVAVGLATALFALILSPLGRAFHSGLTEGWLSGPIGALRHLPVAGLIMAALSALFQTSVAGIARLWQTATSGPALIIAVHVALYAAVYLAAARRRPQLDYRT